MRQNKKNESRSESTKVKYLQGQKNIRPEAVVTAPTVEGDSQINQKTNRYRL